MADFSIVEIFHGDNEGHQCGYCKSDKGSLSYGMWAHQLTVNDYLDLIDRGWRRSGKYCYKPIMRKTCCQLYTIRCDSDEFKLSKSHKKVLRKMHRFLSSGEAQSESKDVAEVKDVDCGPSEFMDLRPRQNREIVIKDFDKNLTKTLSKENLPKKLPSTSCSGSHKGADAKEPNQVVDTEKTKQAKQVTGADPNKPPCKKAKLLRMERKLEKMAKNQQTMSGINETREAKNRPKSLQDYLSDPLPPNAINKLEIKTVRSEPPSAEFLETFDESYELYKKYQTCIHKDPPEKCPRPQFKRFLVNSPLEVKLVSVSDVIHSNFEETFEIFSRYQQGIHGETETIDFDEDSFLEFLITSPLKESADSGLEYGSFHQQYWLNGNLIAVGVIDILPRCVSSVYFYYDPKYSFLSLGTYAALRELAFTQELRKTSENLKYYYMGFYVHSCPKMRYKGQFEPSFLLCPEVYSWHLLDDKVRSNLEATKYCRLEENREAVDLDGEVNLDEVLVLFNRTIIRFSDYKRKKMSQLSDGEAQDVLKYARFVGKRTACSKMLLFRK